MQVQKVSFTSTQKAPKPEETKQSSLYTKQNFLQIGAINDFISASAVGFGILESKSKFKLIKNQTNTLPATLKEIAKKQTKRNIWIGLGIGGLYTALDLFLANKFLPKLEKMYDKIEEIKNNSTVV